MSNEFFLLIADAAEAKLELVIAELDVLDDRCGDLLPLSDLIDLYDDEVNAYGLLIGAVRSGTANGEESALDEIDATRFAATQWLCDLAEGQLAGC